MVERIYSCTSCNSETVKELLTVKKASFFEMGLGGRSIRSRVVGHLCPKCLVQDADFQRPAFDSPGNKQTMRPSRGN